MSHKCLFKDITCSSFFRRDITLNIIRSSWSLYSWSLTIALIHFIFNSISSWASLISDKSNCISELNTHKISDIRSYSHSPNAFLLQLTEIFSWSSYTRRSIILRYITKIIVSEEISVIKVPITMSKEFCLVGTFICITPEYFTRYYFVSLPYL